MNLDLHEKIINHLLKNEKAHADLSASGSERWINCPGSVALARVAPKQKNSKYSLEGSVAHHYLDEWVSAIWYGDKYKVPDSLRHDENMYEAVKRAVGFVIELWDEEKQKLFIEEKISLEYIGAGMFGTSDLNFVELGEHLQIHDYKHGAGKVVEVVEHTDFGKKHNTQLIYYALGMAKRFNYNFKKVTIGIIQPRAGKEWQRSETLTMDELREYEDIFRGAVRRAKDPNAKLNSGSWCHWCPAKDFNCKVQEQLKYKKAKDMFD